jgi:hypothetical protein
MDARARLLMARKNLVERRLAGWIAFCSNSQMREGLKRNAPADFRRENIERAAKALGLDARAMMAKKNVDAELRSARR